MKVIVRIPFYSTETGLVKRGEAELPDDIAKGIIAQGFAEEKKDDDKQQSKTAQKSKGSTKGRNKRV